MYNEGEIENSFCLSYDGITLMFHYFSEDIKSCMEFFIVILRESNFDEIETSKFSLFLILKMVNLSYSKMRIYFPQKLV